MRLAGRVMKAILAFNLPHSSFSTRIVPTLNLPCIILQYIKDAIEHTTIAESSNSTLSTYPWPGRETTGISHLFMLPVFFGVHMGDSFQKCLFLPSKAINSLLGIMIGLKLPLLNRSDHRNVLITRLVCVCD